MLFLAFNFGSFSQQPVLSIIYAVICGFWFDTSALAYFYAPVILLSVLPLSARNVQAYQNSIKILFMLGTLLVLLLNLIDVGYFPISGKRSGFELIKIQGSQNVSPLVYLRDYWYLLLILLCALWLTWKYYPKATASSIKPKTIEWLLLIPLLMVLFIGARGGIGLKPLNTLDAARLTGADLMPLTLNTPFQMLMTIEQTGVTEKHYFDEAVISQLNNPSHTTTANGHALGKNVVLIIVESLGKEYVGYYNKGIGYTPFLDSLMQHSEVYMHAYANGKRSIEGIPAIIASMPGWLEGDYINSFYQTNKLRGIGYYLKQLGYTTSFYHGGKNGTMSFDRFVANTGAGAYFGLNEYPDKERDFDGNWGIPDEPYLQYVGHELSKNPQPFFSTIFTLSSHHPYQLPAAYKNTFKGGVLPIHATIEYADFSLRRFFEFAKKQPWYNHTLFVITADHSSENITPYYQTSQGKYEVPLVVFEPWNNTKNEITSTADHLGIMPIILNRTLPAGSTYFSFSTKEALQYDGGFFQLIDYPFVYKFDGEKSAGFFKVDTDSLMKNDLTGKTDVRPLLHHYDSVIKVRIQDYNHRLITNQTH